MNLRRLRGPLVAAIATMLLAGGSVALATDPSVPPAFAGTSAEEPETSGPDTDLLEVEDQGGANDAAEANDPAEADAGAPDTDNVQEEVGDQSGVAD
ncbi:MAG: hypothetical protein H0W81_05675 [Chloroflexi bacterium]|nr:hypothetical protein [Chloroflexota bacterium]